MRDVFRKIIHSLENNPHEWEDNHKPKGGILEHKSGILIYGSPVARICKPVEIIANWRESWWLNKTMKEHAGRTAVATDIDVIAMLEVKDV